jgi:hypothetical protein
MIQSPTGRRFMGHPFYPPRLARPLLCLASRLLLRMNELSSQTLLEELDARQDELLAELEQLNQQIERVILESAAWRGPAEPLPVTGQ